MSSAIERHLRALVRADLPPDALRRRPWRLLLVVPMVGTIAGLTALVMLAPLPWWAALAVSVLLGNLYVGLMLFGHECAHGSMVRSPRVQDGLLYFTFLIYLIPPHLWRHWHNRAHHAHTNMDPVDPDNFGTYAAYGKWLGAAINVRLAPGSGHWLSTLYLFVAFTTQAHHVLWVKSRAAARARPFRGFRRWRAVAEAVGMAGFWVGLGVWAGPRAAVLGIVVPMIVANFVIMSYVTTNHLLRPLSAEYDSLRTTLSVRTLWPLDLLHLHFSHHVEHHLFPTLSHRYYPAVRASLMRHAPHLYLAPPHWRALWVLFTTPRVYDGPEHLVNPLNGRRVAVADVEARLRRGAPVPPAPPGWGLDPHVRPQLAYPGDEVA